METDAIRKAISLCHRGGVLEYERHRCAERAFAQLAALEEVHVEMYEALAEFLKVHEPGGFIEPDEEVLEEARAALAKARGEA